MNILHLDGKRYRVLSHVMYDRDEYGYPSARMSLLPLPDPVDDMDPEEPGIDDFEKEVRQLAMMGR